MPFKTLVLSHLDELSPAAQAAGAVNTVVVDHQQPGRAAARLVGHNTDTVGFKSAVAEILPPGEERAAALARVALIGAGGAGRAVAVALQQLGCEQLVLIDADASLAEALAIDLRALGSARAAVAAAGDPLEALLAGCTGAVNASPVGMLGSAARAHPLARFPPTVRWVGDTVYAPRVTPWVALARRQRLACVLGERMWLGQVIASF